MSSTAAIPTSAFNRADLDMSPSSRSADLSLSGAGDRQPPSSAKLGQATLQEGPLDRIRAQIARSPVGRDRLIVSPQAAQQVGARRVEQVIALQLRGLREPVHQL